MHKNTGLFCRIMQKKAHKRDCSQNIHNMRRFYPIYHGFRNITPILTNEPFNVQGAVPEYTQENGIIFNV